MKKTITLLLAFALSLALAVPALAYDEATATQRANELYAAGLFNGYGNDANGDPIFALNDTATRAQGITMFVLVLGKADEAQQNAAAYDLPFHDLPDWCRGYVGYAYANKYTSGTSKTTFSPDATVARAQVVTFLARASKANTADGSSRFTDVVDGAWYTAAVDWADKNGITNGVGGGKFGPELDCTRAQIVTMLYRIYSK